MKIRVRATLADDGGREFFGEGVARLLELVRERKSIQGAAREMELSYVKALRILGNAERALGHPLLLRRKGGFARGGADLTPGAERLLAAYADLRRRLDAAAADALPSLLPETPDA